MDSGNKKKLKRMNENKEWMMEKIGGVYEKRKRKGKKKMRE
jgi:ribosomal protein S4E